MHCLPLNFARFFYSASALPASQPAAVLSHSRVCRACFTYANSQVSPPPPPLPFPLRALAMLTSPHSHSVHVCVCMCVFLSHTQQSCKLLLCTSTSTSQLPSPSPSLSLSAREMWSTGLICLSLLWLVGASKRILISRVISSVPLSTPSLTAGWQGVCALGVPSRLQIAQVASNCIFGLRFAKAAIKLYSIALRKWGRRCILWGKKDCWVQWTIKILWVTFLQFWNS